MSDKCIIDSANCCIRSCMTHHLYCV